MRKSLILSVFLVSGAAFARVSEERQVPAFSSVHISSGMRATITLGSPQPVRLEGDERTLSLVETVVEDGTLKVRFKSHSFINDSEGVRVTIQTPELRGVGASGGSIVKAEFSRGQQIDIEASGGSEIHGRSIDAGDLDVEASGGSILTLSGSVDRVRLQLSGGSQLHGRDLSTRDLDVHGSGGSEAELRASGSVRGSLSGGSQLHASGGASTKVSTSGGSEVSSD